VVHWLQHARTHPHNMAPGTGVIAQPSSSGRPQESCWAPTAAQLQHPSACPSPQQYCWYSSRNSPEYAHEQAANPSSSTQASTLVPKLQYPSSFHVKGTSRTANKRDGPNCKVHASNGGPTLLQHARNPHQSQHVAGYMLLANGAPFQPQPQQIGRGSQRIRCVLQCWCLHSALPTRHQCESLMQPCIAPRP
jgi:hypothetical protein